MNRGSSNKQSLNAESKQALLELETSTVFPDAGEECASSGSQASNHLEVVRACGPPASSNDEGHGGGGRRRAEQAQQAGHMQGDKGLYEAILNCTSSVEVLVSDWIHKYEVNKDHGLTMMMQFFLSASGCKIVMTPDMAKIEHKELVRQISEEFDEEISDYPIIMVGSVFKKFKLNLCLFLQSFVYQCRTFILYDKFLMDHVISWLIGLSSTKIRALRHTATLALMKIMSSLAKVAVKVSMDLEEIQRQRNDRSLEDRNADALDSLNAQSNKQQENLKEIQNMLFYIFEVTFSHRYQDVMPEIRAICVEEMGVCISSYPQMFCQDKFLWYIGLLLYDKVGEVRLKCVQALQPLYALEELKYKLQSFTEKFRCRITAMILDRRDDIAKQVIKLLMFFKKYEHTTLTKEEYKRLNDLMFCLNREVAQAAAEFVNENCFTSNEIVEVETNTEKKRLPNTPFIKDLVRLSIESKQKNLEPYLVDSLIEINEMIKDWTCMIDLLLEQPGPNEEDSLDDEEKTFLIKIMTCSIEQAATSEIPYGRADARKTLSAKKKKQAEDEKHNITEHFVKTLPLLIDKYCDDQEKLKYLLSIPQYFELGANSVNKQKKNFDLLVGKITEIINATVDVEVLDALAKTVGHMCKPESAIHVESHEMRSKYVKAILDKYLEAINNIKRAIVEKHKPSDVDICSAQESLMKIASFFSYHDLNHTSLWDSLFQDIRDCILPAEAMKYCISACFSSLMWSQSVLIECESTGDEFDEKCQILKSRHRVFIKFVSPLIGADGVPMMIKEEAFRSVCDLLIVYNINLITKANPQFHQLFYEPDTDLSNVLNQFVQQRVFSDVEGVNLNDDILHQKRTFLAGFCKLIIYNILPAEAAADVFKYYVEYNDVYGDVIKMTINNIRENNKTECALALQRSLFILYTDLDENNRREATSEDFKSIKKLAKQFALFYETDVKNREVMIALHERGIMFAASGSDDVESGEYPAYLSYLGILNEFTKKLVKEDKKIVLNFLNENFRVDAPEKGWQPLSLYRNSLLHDKKATPDDLNVSL